MGPAPPGTTQILMIPDSTPDVYLYASGVPIARLSHELQVGGA